ncbi:uncharacterized protein LOC133805632, partial [Humulus lupulus]|uniref:uncharacterized protein LOC133805632 n=1 Tax=Humulus lupulus TaxID=3486 RepID=UPI002B4081B5
IPSLEQDAVETDWIKYFRYKHRRDSSSDTRNALLVVAALIASVTFQAGVDPSDGFLPKKSETSISSNTYAEAPPPAVNKQPRAVFFLSGVLAFLGVHDGTPNMFLIGNSLGFVTSVSIIIYLTAGFPFQRELHISIYSIMFAYGWALKNIQPDEGILIRILIIAFGVPFLLRWLPRWARTFWKRCKTH